MRALACLFFMFGSSGCSVAGFYVGSSTPRYERITVSTSSLEWRDQIRYGEQIGIRPKQNGSREIGQSAAPWRDGVYEGIDDDVLAISTVDGPDRIPLVDIDEVRVRRGSHWATGVLVGALVDAVIVGCIVASLTGNSHIDIDPSRAH